MSESHTIHVGFRTTRDAWGSYPSMPFARCACGWEGPGRLERGEADRDGRTHLFALDATEAQS
jgi:hypothetical protein